MNANHATPEATAHFARSQEHHPDRWRRFDGLTLSALAVGTYLGPAENPTDRFYEETLVAAVQSGINFFDTAVNYRCQRSERNIAYALRKLAGLGVSRDQIFVSTKGGFLPAEGSAEGFKEYIYKCYLNTGVMTAEDIVANCHCMTPKYLESQIHLSLANLKVEAIDLYYLHNPETQFKAVTEVEFYKRLTQAFELFEKKIAEGKIKRYGIATWNGFRMPAANTELLNLEKIIACAKTVAGDRHGFKAIQVPYNLAMLEAVALQNQKVDEGLMPIIPAAVHHGVGVMVSAPLLQSNVLKIPERVYQSMPGEESAIQKALQFVLSSPGVIAAMTGMKSKMHLDENRQVLNLPNWPVEVLQNVARNLVKV